MHEKSHFDRKTTFFLDIVLKKSLFGEIITELNSVNIIFGTWKTWKTWKIGEGYIRYYK